MAMHTFVAHRRRLGCGLLMLSTAVAACDVAGAPDGLSDAGADAGGSSTELGWQDPPAGQAMGREAARAYCDGLLLDGHDDWRLPTISDLRALVVGCPATAAGGACNLIDVRGEASPPSYQSCEGCRERGGPGAGGCYWRPGLSGPCSTYWSATALFAFPQEGHALDFANASMMTLGWVLEKTLYVRCVRGGA
jgi:hypothetical protein